MNPSFDGTDNVLYRDDIKARLAEIESEYDLDYDLERDGFDGLIEKLGGDEELAVEYEALLDLRDELGDYLDTLVHESHFADYAEDYARSVHGDDAFDAWPGYFIDWERAADALKQDYTELDFRGSTYYAR